MFEVMRNLGFYVQFGETLGFGRWLRFEIDARRGRPSSDTVIVSCTRVTQRELKQPNTTRRMIQVGRLGQADVDAAAGILFDAFGAAYRRRGHAPPFPTRESAAWLCRAYLDLDPEGCALARSSSEVVGVGFAHPRGAVTSIGPLAARPGAPAGVARALMERARRESPAGSTSVRLFQDSFNPDSFGLYTRLGYVVDGRRPLPARGEARAADRPRPRRARRWSPRICRPSNATIGRAPGPTAAATSRCWQSTGGGFVYQAESGGENIAGYLFFRALPARVVIGPAVAESAECSPPWSTAWRRACPGGPR